MKWFVGWKSASIKGLWTMLRTVKYCFIAMLFVNVAWAASKHLELQIGELVGKDVLYSSPFLRGDEAVLISVQTADVSEDFFDDGKLILNGNEYPADQLFLRNDEAQWENLTSLYDYSGVAGTFFVKYYDKERLAVADEKAKLLADAKRCVLPFKEGEQMAFIMRGRGKAAVWTAFLKDL